MPDKLDDLSHRLARALTSVQWAEPGELRARARRRSRRAFVAAPVAVTLVVLSVAWYAGFRGDGAPVADDSTIGPSSSTTTTPSPRPSLTMDPAWIPLDALLQPADVGEGLDFANVLTSDSEPLRLWYFELSQCPAYAGLGITAYDTYQYMRIHQIVPRGVIGGERGDAVFVQARRYPAEVASTVVLDIRRALTACGQYERAGGEASSPQRPAYTTFTWTIIDEDFAGDDSLLIRQRVESFVTGTGQRIGESIVETYAVVRVGDVITIVSRYSADEAEIANLATKAAARLCIASNPRC